MIGIFDSGVGGLTVLREVRRQLPDASILYFADTANVPYGDKPLPVVCRLAVRLTERLIESGAQAVIMASGTSTVAGLKTAQTLFPSLPILGTIEPGARTALAATPGAIGVLATNATVHSLAFTDAVHQIDPTRRVVEVGCPKFVPLVESGRAETGEARDAAAEYLRPLIEANVEAIILGCTHFPFLIPALQAASHALDPRFQPIFVDPARESVCDLCALLPHDFASPPSVRFAATGDPQDFAKYASALLGETISDVSFLNL